MRILVASVIALFLAARLAAFELFLNTGKEGGSAISVLHLKNPAPFSCEFVTNDQLEEFYRCVIEGKSKFISNQDLALFSLEWHNRAHDLELIIRPKVPSRLLDAALALHESQNVYVRRVNKSTEFSIEFYPAGFAAKAPNGLDFVVTFKDLRFPFIGALDLDQNPVNISDNNDINIYLNMKKTLEAGDFKRLQEAAENAIERYPNSIFLSEFYLYRLRALFGQIEHNTSFATEVIDGGKDFMRGFSSSQNYTEVVRMMVRSHLKLQQRSDADYYIDILNAEQPDDYFTRLANLDYADYLSTHQRIETAIELYNNILFTAKEPELASRAAYALAKISLAAENIEEAGEFVGKIIRANEEFLMQYRSKSIAMADEFFQKAAYLTASSMYEVLLKHMARHEAGYERIMRNLAISYFKEGEHEKAKALLARYKKEFPVGEFAQNMDELNDELYFELPGVSGYALHEHYRLLMAKYDNQIGARALREEAKLLFSERDFDGIFALKDKIMESKDEELIALYKNALQDLLLGALHRDECAKAERYVNELPTAELLKLAAKSKLLSCLHREQNYAKEREMAELFRQHSERFDYDIVLARLDYLEHRYDEVISRLKRALKTRRALSSDDLSAAYYLLAPSLLEANSYNEAAAALRKLEQLAAPDMKLVEIYAKFLGYFKLHNLGISAINYGTKAIEIQNRLGINYYSPELEFITIEALLARQRYADAVAISHDLSKLPLSDEQATRMHYLSAQALLAQGDKDKAASELAKCATGQWKQLCDELASTIN